MAGSGALHRVVRAAWCICVRAGGGPPAALALSFSDARASDYENALLKSVACSVPGQNGRMRWRRAGTVLAGSGAGVVALLVVWFWPGRDVPPSMGPAVVVPALGVPEAPRSSPAVPGGVATGSLATPRPSATVGDWVADPSPRRGPASTRSRTVSGTAAEVRRGRDFLKEPRTRTTMRMTRTTMRMTRTTRTTRRGRYPAASPGTSGARRRRAPPASGGRRPGRLMLRPSASARSRIVGWMLLLLTAALAVPTFGITVVWQSELDRRIDEQLLSEAEKLRAFARTSRDPYTGEPFTSGASLLTAFMTVHPPSTTSPSSASSTAARTGAAPARFRPAWTRTRRSSLWWRVPATHASGGWTPRSAGFATASCRCRWRATPQMSDSPCSPSGTGNCGTSGRWRGCCCTRPAVPW